MFQRQIRVTSFAAIVLTIGLAASACGSSSSGGSGGSGNKADVGLVFSSDATVAAKGLVVLTDDKHLQASDNIVPVVAKSLATGPAATILNAVDAKLDQATLVSLNTAVGIDHGQPADVASQFLSQAGLSGSSACGGKGSGKIVVGSASFTENALLGTIYAAALKNCGYSTSTKTFDSREVYYPALVKGKLQVVPEYAATLTDFINQQKNGANAPSKASGQITTTMTALTAELPSNLAALTPATATDTNSFAVTKAFATANKLTSMSDLAAYSQDHPLTLAGPAECPTRPYCEPGLKTTYGMKIGKFVQTDAGGPLTIKALTSS